MKLEPDLIREILVWCEDNLPNKEKNYEASELSIKGYTSDQIVYHITLLSESGYIDVLDASAGNQINYFLNRLTMNGHQYLSLLRSKAWKTAKSLLHEVGVIFAESAIKAVIEKGQLSI